MRQRFLHTAQDGSVYSDKVTIFFTSATRSKQLIFELDPDMLYLLLHDALVKMALQEKTQPTDGSETGALRQRVSKLAKQAMRAGLLMFGNDLLTLLYGTKEHERLPKNTDALDWYTDQFTRIGVAYLLKQDTYIAGRFEDEDERSFLYTVDELVTKPVTAQLASVGTTNSDQ